MRKKNFINGEEYCCDDSSDVPQDRRWCQIPDYLDITFYRCDICGQIMATIGEQANLLSCCGQKMTLLHADTVDASVERHVPVYRRIGHKITVQVGEIEHPMTEDHHIEWICMVTCCGIQWKPLPINGTSDTTFRIKGNEDVLAIYSYCNLHGLWKGIRQDE